LHLPSGYDDRQKTPLILNLHGSASTAAAQAAFSGMNGTADADGFIVAYPQAAIAEGTGFDWNVPGQPLLGGSSAPANAPNDVDFLKQTMRTLEAGLCVDTTRIYVTGFSGGARMASQLGCDLSTVVAAIAPVSGLRFPNPCPATRPVPVMAFSLVPSSRFSAHSPMPSMRTTPCGNSSCRIRSHSGSRSGSVRFSR
jgi:polyhydroxybutyrate depolymerase